VFFGRKILFCYHAVIDDDFDIEATVTHELFHAFQFGFKGLPFSVANPFNTTNQWVLEGTAMAAEFSYERMARSLIAMPLHPIDHGLTGLTADDFYRVQDFWVYFGQKNGLGLDYLKPLFERGGTTAAASEFFANVHQIFTGIQQTSLGAEYWAWVKNQAIEKTLDLHVLTNPCRIVSDNDVDKTVIGQVSTLKYSGNLDEISSVFGNIKGLTAKVVQITFTKKLGPIKITAGEATGGLAYKVYLNGEELCAKLPDNERTFLEVSENDTVYVILANTELDGRSSYRVEVKPADPVPRAP